jgi:preprotein translocase subunit SecA
MVPQMIKIGEQSGKIDEMMGKTAQVYEDELDDEQLVARLKEELHFIVKIEDIKSEDYETLENRLVQILKDVYEQKMSKVGDKQKSEIERILYLQILDNAYREHLYAMDTLKTGIGLRGYNQKDPLVEYKKESYNMFIDLVSNIKLEIIKILFTIQLQSKEEQEALDKVKANMEKSNEHITTNLAQEAVKSSDKKIARNEVCPCGCGLKYKQCCGKSGPKRYFLTIKFINSLFKLNSCYQASFWTTFTTTLFIF